MHYQKSSCLLAILLCFGRMAYTQDSTALQLGFYGGGGVVYSTFPNDYFAADFRGGFNLIKPFKKNSKIRFEFQAQYDAHLPTSHYYTTNDKKWHHNFSGYRYDNLNFNFLFHFPLFYKERYKLFIAPGINTGLLYEDRLILPGFGLILSLKQEFRLNNRLSLHLDVNSLNQVSIFNIFLFTGAVNIGLSWRIFQKNESKKANEID